MKKKCSKNVCGLYVLWSGKLEELLLIKSGLFEARKESRKNAVCVNECTYQYHSSIINTWLSNSGRFRLDDASRRANMKTECMHRLTLHSYLMFGTQLWTVVQNWSKISSSQLWNKKRNNMWEDREWWWYFQQNWLFSISYLLIPYCQLNMLQSRLGLLH